MHYRCNLDANREEVEGEVIFPILMTSKLDENIIHKLDQKLDQKRINRSKLDAI